MNVPNLLPTDTNNMSAPNASSINMADPVNLLASTTPNSKPREQTMKKLQTYVYQDFANAEPTTLNTGTCHERVPPHSLQSQKLPSKLASMLSDPDLASVITWMPHGRSWKIINRELFSTFALPRYFGHSNHASFVRIVNAWGFRRITKGPDRDSYYHELFLRGKPRLHERMKRLPTCHRKTPVDKEGKCPDFYELAKISPLPEVGYSNGEAGPTQVRSNASTMMNQVPAGFGNNPMASLGMGNPMLTQQMNQGNDMSSLLSLLRNQGNLQQKPIQQQPPVTTDNNSMNQNLMQQLLSMQSMNAPAGGAQANSLGLGGSAMGQFSTNFNQVPAPVPSGSNQMMNSFTAGMNMNGNQPAARRLSNDKISVNDVIQLRSIERTNELLAQKLATMQQDTNTMKQNSSPSITAAPGNSMQAMPVKLETLGAGGLGVATSSTSPSVGNAAGAAGGPSKEEMLLQMMRRQNQMGTGASSVMQNKPASNPMEDNSNMSQGLNNLLKSLTGMQQQQQQQQR